MSDLNKIAAVTGTLLVIAGLMWGAYINYSDTHCQYRPWLDTSQGC